MKNSIYIFFILSLLGCSNNESEQLEGFWSGNLIYGVEESIPFDSTQNDNDSLLTLEQQLGDLKYYEEIIHDSIIFIVKEDSILTNAETGELHKYLILDPEKSDELLLFNKNNILSFNIIRYDKDSLIIEPSIKPFSFGKSKIEIVKTEYRLRKK